MIYIDLFSGIGGFALGAYWAGMRFDKHYFSEVDKDAIELYRKRCPDAIPLGDITKIDWKTLADAESIGSNIHEFETGKYSKNAKERQRNIIGENSQMSRDVPEYIITGGFPCQDISVAGKGKGITGSRSGLWFEMLKCIRILRPRFVIAENVGAITFRGLDTVLGTLAEIGYDAEWQDIRASDMGAPHRRERIWIVAYPNSGTIRQLQCDKLSERQQYSKRRDAQCKFNPLDKDVPNPNRKHGNNAGHGTSEICRERSEQAEVQRCKDVADTDSSGRKIQREVRQQGTESWIIEKSLDKCSARSRPGEWLPEPCMGVLVNGLPSGLDRFEGRLSNKSYKAASQIKGIGNSILSQIAELLFLQIKDLI